MARDEVQLTPEEQLTVGQLEGIANNTVIYKDNAGVYQSVVLGASGTVLQSNGTTSAPSFAIAGAGDMVRAFIQRVTGLKTFDKDKLAMKGTSTGTTTVSTANTGASNYTQTMQARDGTIANLDNETYIGTTAVALNRTSAALTLAGITLTTPDIGTPASGTLTNCTGLPLAGVVDSTTEALGVGSLEVGHSTDTTITRSSAGVIAVEGVTVPTISSTNTLTNKRITNRITTITSSATPTINTDNCDCATITALAEAITSMTTNLSGTPTNFQKLIIRIKDNGTARAITWGASFEAKGVALPTTTVISKVLTVGFIYDTVTSKWGCVASVQEI